MSHLDSRTGEPSAKRPRVETNPAHSPALSFGHRWSIPHRAALNNAADTPYFSRSKALVYHFVDVLDPIENSVGELQWCKLQCGVCGGAKWTWQKGGKSKGSTSNMIKHMNDKHTSIWDIAKQLEKSALGTREEALPSDRDSSEEAPMQPEPEFDPDVFDQLVARWIVSSNKTFAETIENEEFQEVIDLVRPGYKLRTDAIKERVWEMLGSGNV